MNTSIFFSISLGAVAAVAVALAAPALAQGNQNGMASGYCTGETIQVGGWERDLVRRNKGLEKFHWSAINTVAHYNVMPTPCSNKTPAAAKPLTPYHNVKPIVTSTWSSLKVQWPVPVPVPVPDKTCIATVDNSRRKDANAQLRSTGAYAQLAHSYSGNYSNQQTQYGGERSTDNKVSGRLMHY